MKGWKECKLGDIAEFKNGKARPSCFENGTIPVYGGNGILGYTDTSNYNNSTVIVGRVGAYCGSVFFENTPIWISDNALYTIPKNMTDIKFLYYLLKNMNLNLKAEGSSHPLLTQTLLNSLDIFITTSFSEQCAIAGVLSSLDDKIALLHRQNKTLEGMAEALWRKMFIEEAGEDWEKTSVGEVISVKGGTTPSSNNPDFWDGDIPWTSPRDLSSHDSVYMFDTSRKITRAGLAQIGSGLLPAGSVLLSSRAPIGYLVITNIEVAINQGYIGIICDKDVSNYYMYVWIRQNMDTIIGAANGSTFLEISKSVFKELEFILPSKRNLESYDYQVSPIFTKIRKNQLQIRSISRLRDTLLPKLMSGKMRVRI
jgi:type I restriction enzyme S subunit